MTTTCTRGLFAALAAAISFLDTSAASARADDQPSAAFGRPGTLVLAASAASALHQNAAVSDSNGSAVETPGQTALALSAAAHVFVASRWSVGIGGTESWNRIDSAGTRLTLEQYEVTLRVGRLLPAGAWASVWPQLGLGFVRATIGTETGGAPPDVAVVVSPASHELTMVAELDVPLLLQPSRSFFVALGPLLQLRVGSDSDLLTVGGRITFGAAMNLAGG